MKTIILFLFLSSITNANCYVVEELGTGKPVKIESSQRPRNLIILPSEDLNDPATGKCSKHIKGVAKTVDDLSKQRLLTVPKGTSCDGLLEPECADLFADESFCEPGDAKKQGDLQWSGEGPLGDLEVWCVHTGAQPTKQITVYKFDQVAKDKAISDAIIHVRDVVKPARDLKTDRFNFIKEECPNVVAPIVKAMCEHITGD